MIINQLEWSDNEVAVVHEVVGVAAESTLENILSFYLYSFGAFGDFVANLSAVITNIIGRLMFKQIFIQQFRLLKILLHKYLRVVVGTFASFLAVTIHIVPAKFSNDVLVFTCLTKNAKSHVVVWTTFINVPELTMVTLGTLIFHKLLTDLYIVTEVAFIPIRTATLILEFITRFYFTSVVNIRTCLSTFPMNEFFADSILC